MSTKEGRQNPIRRLLILLKVPLKQTLPRSTHTSGLPWRSWRPWRLTLCLLLLAAQAPAAPTLNENDQGPALTERERALHALNRLAFGPRPGDVDRVAALGWQAWARQQLDPGSIPNDAVNARTLELAPSLGMTLDQALATYRPPYEENESPEQQQRRNELRGQIQQELRDAVLYRAAHSERQFEEVILEFWRNHLNIDQNKDDVGFLANDYEVNVLRKHAFGKYEDMLLASATHPAMLIYLDNIVSQRPLSEREQSLLDRYTGRGYTPRSVQALGRQRGLNENYARELMELHTLGVDRDYSQRDVTELARILTGWSAGEQADGTYGFVFRNEVHDDDHKRLFGATLRGGGLEQGVAVVRGLANHELTADFISRKLCRYLLRDEPSERLVADVARVFRKTDGDLPKVYEAIVFSPDFLFRQNHRVKFKTPFEFAISAVRAVDGRVEAGGGLMQMLGVMGQPTYACVDPPGYDDRAEAWLDPGVLVYRWVFALRLARNDIGGVRVPDRALANVSADQLDATLLNEVLPEGLDAQTRETIRLALERGGVEAALAAVFGSAEFQQQ